MRFSEDKRPYNTHLHFRFWGGADKKTAPAWPFTVSRGGKTRNVSAYFS